MGEIITRGDEVSQAILMITKQQDILMQLVSALIVDRGRQDHSGDVAIAGGQNVSQSPERNYSSLAQAVKFLSSLIPQFGGSEEENIDLWLEKIESIAELHDLSEKTRLSAASSNLIKSARKWFDLKPGEINRSWSSFKGAVIRRFRRRVSISSVIHKIEAKKWNPVSESFQDYTIDKLEMMHCLKLTSDDAIFYLISGINNMAVRAAAASLRRDDVDLFLEEMFYITSACGDVQRKQSSFVPKGNRPKE